MLVGDVESITGLSKKSIRYYEDVGLIKPDRNRLNDYRLYSLEDIEILKKIKFLRELGVSIHDIKLLNDGGLTLLECMNERIQRIESEEEKFKKIKNMCMEISKSTDTFFDIKIEKYFRQMNILNKEGFTMRDVSTNHAKKIRGAVFSSLFFGAFFIILIIGISYFQFMESVNMPWVIYFLLLFFLLFPVISILYNLVIRIKEINGGEEDEASKY